MPRSPAPAASMPINPPAAHGPRNGDLPAYIGNGLIGLRVREQPLHAGMAIVSGFAGEPPERRVEAAAPAPYPLAGDLALNSVWVSDQPSSVSDLFQAYDFATGELMSRFRFEAAGVVAEVEVLTFASRTAPTVVMQEITVRSDQACDLALRAVVETAGLRGRVVRHRSGTLGEPEPACDSSLLWQSEGGLSSCGFALATELKGGDAERSVETWDVSGPLRTEYRLRTRAGRAIRMRQIVAILPSVLHDRPDEEAVRRVARAGLGI